MNRVIAVPDHALLRLACKSETGDQTMYNVEQSQVDQLAYVMETPKDERPKVFCLGREWIIAARVMGSLFYDSRKREFCWRNAWLVVLENDDDSMNLLGPLSCFSIPIRDAIFN